jgi:hypothetical protein
MNTLEQRIATVSRLLDRCENSGGSAIGSVEKHSLSKKKRRRLNTKSSGAKILAFRPRGGACGRRSWIPSYRTDPSSGAHSRLRTRGPVIRGGADQFGRSKEA